MAAKQKRKSEVMIVGPFRMAFPALLEPEETDNGDRYKVTMLFPPDYDLRPIRDAMRLVMEDAFGDEDDWPTGRNDILPDDKLYDAGTKKYAGFEKGWHAMSVSSIDAPGLVDAKNKEVMSKREVYGGRWARAEIVITTYDNKSKGVGAYLNHVQVLDHDEAFSGRGDPTKAFGEYEMKDRRDTRDRDGERPRDRERSRDNDDKGDTKARGSRDDAREDRGRRDDGGREADRESRGGRSERDNDRERDREERPKRGDDSGARERSGRSRDADWD